MPLPMTTLRILLLEDNENDAILLARELRASGHAAEVKRVYTKPAFVEALALGGWDAVLADYNVPGFDALAAIEAMAEAGVDLPFIIVSGEVGEEKAVLAMKAGAHDFIVKGSLARLIPALEREVRDATGRRERQQEQLSLRESEVSERARREELEALMEAIPAAVWIAHDAGCLKITGNKRSYEFLGVEPGRNISKSSAEGFPTHEVWVEGRLLQPDELPLQRATATGKLVAGKELEIRRTDGRVLHVYGNAVPVFDPTGKVRGAIATFVDISARKAAEEALREANDKLEHRVAERTAELRAANAQLEQAGAERQRLEAAIASAAENERQALRYDLHDGLCQELAGIGFMSNVLARNLADCCDAHAADASAIAKLVNETLTHTRMLARGASPIDAGAEGLMGALKELASTTARTYGIACHFTCPKPVLVASSLNAGHLYRIAQEAVHNAVEHGKARRIAIELAASPASSCLRIVDDGRGFSEKEAAHPGMGVRVMRHRAESIGGKLRIAPADGGGTMVACEWK